MKNIDTTKYFVIEDKAGVKTSNIFKEMQKLFDVWSYYDDTRLDNDFPAPQKTTTRYFEKNIEADEEFKNMSANDLERQGIKGITLRERLLMEIEYFKETGGHLDIDNITLCSGSRNSDGSVPGVGWYGDDRKVCVDWYGPSRSYLSLRARAAQFLTLDSSSFNPVPELTIESLHHKVDILLDHFGLRNK
jgi:hypothetical protein